MKGNIAQVDNITIFCLRADSEFEGNVIYSIALGYLHVASKP